MFRSIRTKIMVVQIGLVLSVIISLGIASYVLTYNSLQESQKENMQYITEHIKEQICENIYHKEQLLEKISHSDVVLNYYKKQQENSLAGYLERFTQEFDSIAYANDKGQEQLKFVNGKYSPNYNNLANSAVFRLAINNPNKAVNSYIPFSTEINGACIEFGICEKDFFDDFIGYISARVSVSQIIKNFDEFKKNEEGFAILIDSEGAILASKDSSILLNKLEINGREAERILSELKISRNGYGRTNVMGVDSYISYAPIQNGKLSLVVIHPYSYFAYKLNALKNTIILAGLTILILGFVLSMFVASDITEPVIKLLKTTSLISKGDFTQRVAIDTNDEMGRLSTAFNQMIENLQKTTTSMVNLNKEIVERQKAENAQQSLNEKLEKTINNLTLANMELADFAHVAAHDLKAPLRAIGSLAGIMLADYGPKIDEQGKFYLNTLVKRTERMSELISGILTYSDIGRTTSIMPVNMNDVIRQVLTNLQIPNNIDVVLETDFPIVYCGKMHMQQVFNELIGNAIKYIDKPKGCIRLKCINKEDYWLFCVSDNGRGIDEKYYDKIFKIFQILVRRDEEESTGIGLSVVKRIIEKYNGKIWVESQPKIGTTFFFTLRKEKTEVNNEKLQTNSIS